MAGDGRVHAEAVAGLALRFGGFGVQLNQHALAPQSMAFLPKASTKDAAAQEALVADLKAKIRTLAPHAVRIFFNNDQEGVPSTSRSRSRR